MCSFSGFVGCGFESDSTHPVFSLSSLFVFHACLETRQNRVCGSWAVGRVPDCCQRCDLKSLPTVWLGAYLMGRSLEAAQIDPDVGHDDWQSAWENLTGLDCSKRVLRISGLSRFKWMMRWCFWCESTKVTRIDKDESLPTFFWSVLSRLVVFISLLRSFEGVMSNGLRPTAVLVIYFNLTFDHDRSIAC